MSLSVEEIKRIAHLARIAVSEDEALALQQQMVGIFRLIEEMQAVDTRGIEPMSHAQDVDLRLREDVVTEGDRRDELLALAPQTEAGLYLVPRVIE